MFSSQQPRSDWFETLLAARPAVNPSLLAADFANLQRDVRRAESAGAKILHLDIMDGHFVPNLSIGVPVVAAIRRITTLPLDVHLMLSEPQRYIRPFREAGADILTIHIEVVPDPTEILSDIRQLGARPGLALNPPTPVETVLPFVNQCDLILAMSVMPGFGGQSFNPLTLEKLRVLKTACKPEMLLSVDGGINETTISQCVSAGANLLVAGTAFFAAGDLTAQMKKLLTAMTNSYPT